ncbi:unnamed protein product [Diatraea saccharalis]|uniref:Centrosomal protein CEP104 N-terminal domain-containing protein n=1 Tax=Diatraea saccharalis TaxID=40085 RepID=A0A9N9RAZ0_9NEOP|nr:unnamed protein product [Diatraea saccharalis]
MPKRIPFHVVYATSEDSSYPACELNSQGPAARGWRSAGAPPHELLLRLSCITNVHKLQLLAHHQLIPECVEVLVSGGLISEGAATPCGATYTSVGRVTLARPTLQARTRELRSAALPEPTIARFVKLRLSGPHAPAQEDEQVALMAVNVLGEEIEDPEKFPEASPKSEPNYSPYDDLAFVMYVDTEIADLVRTLDEKKKIAVAEERFEYARRLKSAGSALAAAGIRIGRWRLRKRTAAARDDFELARRMRDRIADALVGVKEDPQLCRLFEEDGEDGRISDALVEFKEDTQLEHLNLPEEILPDHRNDSSMPQEYDFSHHLSPSVVAGSLSLDIPSPVPPIDEPELERELVNGDDEEEVQNQRAESPIEPVQEEIRQLSPEPPPPVHEDKVDAKKIEEDELRKETDSPRRSITPNAANGTLVRRRNKSAGPRSTFEAYEERLLPALRHSHTNEYLREAREEECSGGSAASHPRPLQPHKLNERERKQAALPILIFGYPLVEKFYSKSYLDKEEGLARLRAELTAPTNGSTKTSPNKTARAAAILLQRTLRDKVFSVYSQTNEVVRVLFQEFVPDRVCAAEVGRCLEKLLPELLRACGDPAPRVHSTAQHTVLTVADCPHVRSLHVIPQQLVRPIPASMHPRLALSRLQMLEQLVLTHGISNEKNSGLTVRRLAECGASGAQHAAGSVRAAAERILLAAYGRSPRVVRAQLPPDDAVTRRNLIYRHLFQQFDRIDMQKILNQAPTEEQLTESAVESCDTASVAHSSRTTASGTTASFSMTSSIGVTSSYSLKSMTSHTSGSTLAPSSLSGSYTTRTSKSSLKRSPTKRYTPSRTTKDSSNYPGYNKLRLDSAVSPKHSPRSTPNATEKVHFEDKSEQVVLRRSNRNTENRHSMIHYDHETSKPQLKERPVTVYEPLHIDYRDSPSLGSPKTSKNDLRSMDSLPMDSPVSRSDLRCDSDCRSLDSPKVKAEFFRESVLESPKLVAGLRNLHLDDHSQMDESGYYSPGRRQQLTNNEQYESYEGNTVDVPSDNTPEPYDLQLVRQAREGGVPGGPLLAALRAARALPALPRRAGGEDAARTLVRYTNLLPPPPPTTISILYRIMPGGPLLAALRAARALPALPRRAGGEDAARTLVRYTNLLPPPPPTTISILYRIMPGGPLLAALRAARALPALPRRAGGEDAARTLVRYTHPPPPTPPITISILSQECSLSEGSWKACQKCGAALRTDEREYHVNCIPLGMDEWKCPYCFTNVLARDLPWQRHLMQCPRNPRLGQN